MLLSHFVKARTDDALLRPDGIAEGVPVVLVAVLTSALAIDIQDAHERLQARSDRGRPHGRAEPAGVHARPRGRAHRAGRRGNTSPCCSWTWTRSKSVNDRFGHEAGNRALDGRGAGVEAQQPFGRSRGALRGDEFLMFSPGPVPEIAKVVANRSVTTSPPRPAIGGSLHRVTVSIGPLFPWPRQGPP